MEDEAGVGSITLLTVIFIGLLIFMCHFCYIFEPPLLMIDVFQHFLGLDPLTLPVHLRLVVCTDLYLGYAACFCIFPTQREPDDRAISSVS